MRTIFILIVVAAVIGFSIPVIQAQVTDGEIPSWVKKNMIFWGDGLLEDNEMMNMLQWLINSDIIQVGENSNKELEQTISELRKIIKQGVEIDIGVEDDMSAENPDVIAEKDAKIAELELKIAELDETIEKNENEFRDKFTIETDAIKDSYTLDLKAYKAEIKTLKEKILELEQK